VRVLLSARIRRREFGKSIPAEDLPVIARSARAALAVPIAAKGLPAGTRLLKAYATSPRGAKRVVYLLVLDGGDLFLLFYRGKDDPLGRNVSLVQCGVPESPRHTPEPAGGGHRPRRHRTGHAAVGMPPDHGCGKLRSGRSVQARSVAPRADWKTATRRSWAACTSSSLRVRSAAR
jgi:hypothetical protein